MVRQQKSEAQRNALYVAKPMSKMDHAAALVRPPILERMPSKGPADFSDLLPVREQSPSPPPRRRKQNPVSRPHQATEENPVQKRRTDVSKPKPARKPRQNQICARVEKHKTDHSREKLHLVEREFSRRHVTRKEKTDDVFDTNGTKIRSTTTVETAETDEATKHRELTWEHEREKRVSKIAELRVLGEEKASESQAFRYYLSRVTAEAQILSQLITLTGSSLDPHADTFFLRNRDIVCRFLFGMPSSFSPELCAWPNASETLWLACLWTLEEMLDLCNDADICEQYRHSPFHREDKRLLANKTQTDACAGQKPLFMLSQRTLAGYMTGQLLFHVAQLRHVLGPYVRDCVRVSEREKPYYPVFESFCVEERKPTSLRFTYNFYAVHVHTRKPLPKEVAFACSVKGTCCVVDEGVECEGYFLALLQDTGIKSRCFCEFEKVALERPYDSETYGTDMDMLDMCLKTRLRTELGPQKAKDDIPLDSTTLALVPNVD